MLVPIPPSIYSIGPDPLWSLPELFFQPPLGPYARQQWCQRVSQRDNPNGRPVHRSWRRMHGCKQASRGLCTAQPVPHSSCASAHTRFFELSHAHTERVGRVLRALDTGNDTGRAFQLMLGAARSPLTARTPSVPMLRAFLCAQPRPAVAPPSSPTCPSSSLTASGN